VYFVHPAPLLEGFFSLLQREQHWPCRSLALGSSCHSVTLGLPLQSCLPQLQSRRGDCPQKKSCGAESLSWGWRGTVRLWVFSDALSRAPSEVDTGKSPVACTFPVLGTPHAIPPHAAPEGGVGVGVATCSETCLEESVNLMSDSDQELCHASTNGRV
jgi:hypothetical protein